MKKSCKNLVCLLMSVALIVTMLVPAAASDPIAHLTSFDDVCCFGGDGEQFDDYALFSDGLLAVCLADKWGYINASGEIVIDFTYEWAYPFEKGAACVGLDGKKLVIDKTGQVLADLSAYDSIENGGNGTVIVKKDSLYGVVSTGGTVRIAPAWDSLSRASDGMHVVSKDGKYGYITMSGTTVLAPAYVYAYPFTDGAAYVETADGSHQLIDRSGNVLLEDVYSSIVDGIVVVQQDDLWGFADQTGEIHVECVWDDVQAPSEGLVAVCKDDLWGFADYSGTVVIEPQWSFVWDFSNDMAITAQISSETGATDLYGFINKIGLEICAPQYAKLLPFSEGYAAFLDGKTNLWGYLDKEGNVAVEAAYDEAMPFSDGYALIRKGSKYSLIDTKGLLLTVSNVEGAWLTPGNSTELTAPPVIEEPEKEPVDIGRMISLILSLSLIAFFVTSLVAQMMYLHKKRKNRRGAAVSRSDPYEDVPYEDENFFGSVMDLNEKMKSQAEDYDDYDISAYYDDLNGEDPAEEPSEAEEEISEK